MQALRFQPRPAESAPALHKVPRQSMLLYTVKFDIPSSAPSFFLIHFCFALFHINIED